MTAGALAWQLIEAVRAQRRVMLSVLPGVAVAMLNSTMLDLARTDIIQALDTDRYRFGWITGAYILGAAVGMALTQFFGRRMGLRLTFVGSMALFACAAGACAGADNIVEMTPFRLAQGLTMGLAISSAMVLIWQAFPEHKEFAMAVYAMAVYVPSLAGTTMGGVLTAEFGWRAIFLLNVPAGSLTAVAAWRFLPDDRPQGSATVAGGFDWTGLALLAATIVTLNVVLDLGQYWGWFNSPFFLPWFLACVVLGVAFTLWGVFAPDPLINLRPLAIRHFGLGLGIKVLYSVNLYVLAGLLAGYMIDLRGYQWMQGAVVFVPGLLAMVTSLVVGTWFGTDANRKARMFFGLSAMAAATFVLSYIDVYTAKTWQAAVLCGWGLGAGLVCGPGLLTMFEGLATDETLASAGVFNIARSLPAFLASGLLMVLVTRHTDENFEWIRLKISDGRPPVAAALQRGKSHMIARGSTHDAAGKQTHALLGQWVHANARAFALRDALRWLALAPCAGLLLVLAVRVPGAHRARASTRSRKDAKRMRLA